MNFKKIVTGILVLGGSHLQAQTDTAFAYQKPLFDYDYSKPVFVLEAEPNGNLYLRYAALTGYREGVKSNTQVIANHSEEHKTNQFYWNNVSAKDFLMISLLILPGRFLFQVKDPSKYMYDISYGDEKVWLRKNGYCFEYMLPAGAILNPERQQKFIEGMLGVEGNWEMRKVKCYAVVRTSKLKKLTSGGTTVPGVIKRLEAMYGVDGKIYGSPLPLINESGYSDGVGMKGDFLWTDLATVRKKFQQEGLDLEEKVLETRVYVVKETNE